MMANKLKVDFILETYPLKRNVWEDFNTSFCMCLSKDSLPFHQMEQKR